MYTGNRKNDQSFDRKDAKTLPGLFASTAPVPMVIFILLEITVPTEREPTITSFVFLSNNSDKRLGRPFLLKVRLPPLFFNNVFQEFVYVRLKVNFEYGFENF